MCWFYVLHHQTGCGVALWLTEKYLMSRQPLIFTAAVTVESLIHSFEIHPEVSFRTGFTGSPHVVGKRIRTSSKGVVSPQFSQHQFQHLYRQRYRSVKYPLVLTLTSTLTRKLWRCRNYFNRERQYVTGMTTVTSTKCTDDALTSPAAMETGYRHISKTLQHSIWHSVHLVKVSLLGRSTSGGEQTSDNTPPIKNLNSKHRFNTASRNRGKNIAVGLSYISGMSFNISNVSAIYLTLLEGDSLAASVCSSLAGVDSRSFGIYSVYADRPKTLRWTIWYVIIDSAAEALKPSCLCVWKAGWCSKK